MRCPHICPICGEKCFTYPDALTGGFVHAHEWVNFRDAIEITKRCLSSAAKPSGIDLIAAERQRQIDAEGWTPEHDDEHAGGVLLRAAACYMKAEVGPSPDEWPWEEYWWKPSQDHVRNLVKAGALIAAEIDRLQRASSAEILAALPEVKD